MFSALPSNSDIALRSRHVSKVPKADQMMSNQFSDVRGSSVNPRLNSSWPTGNAECIFE
jgi:hypothetical protein